MQKRGLDKIFYQVVLIAIILILRLSHQALLAQPVWTRTARKNRSVHVVREV